MSKANQQCKSLSTARRKSDSLISALLRTSKEQRNIFADVQKLLGWFQDTSPEFMSSSAYELWDAADELYRISLRLVFGRKIYDAYHSWSGMLCQLLEELSFRVTFPLYTYDEFVTIYGEDSLEEFYDMWLLDTQEDREGFVDSLSVCRISYSDTSLPTPLDTLVHRFQTPGGDWGIFSYALPTGGRIDENEKYIEFYFSVFPIDDNGRYDYGYDASEVSFIVILLMDFEELYQYAQKKKGGNL